MSASSPGAPVTPAKAGAATAPRELNAPERLRLYLATGATSLAIDRQFALALLDHTRSRDEIMAETRDKVTAALLSANLARCEAELRADRAEASFARAGWVFLLLALVWMACADTPLVAAFMRGVMSS